VATKITHTTKTIDTGPLILRGGGVGTRTCHYGHRRKHIIDSRE